MYKFMNVFYYLGDMKHIFVVPILIFVTRFPLEHCTVLDETRFLGCSIL